MQRNENSERGKRSHALLQPPITWMLAPLVSRERANEITAAVESLPDRQRTVFTLCHLAEQTTAEVSQALGVSEATVRVHLFRAIRKLRRLLERN